MFADATALEPEESFVAPLWAVGVLNLPVLDPVVRRAPPNDERGVIDGLNTTTKWLTVIQHDDAAAVRLQFVSVDANGDGTSLEDRTIKRFFAGNLR